jgi:Calcineurin-like phosphoesterase
MWREAPNRANVVTLAGDWGCGPRDMMTYAIGDVHGCLEKLAHLLLRCVDHAGRRPQRLVLVGDYIDRGPDSRGVIDLLIKVKQEIGNVITLRGNHEAMMLDAIGTGDDGLWRLNGADQTLASYGIAEAADVPRKHVEWVAALPLCFDDGRRYFVHAGVDPTRSLSRQSEHDQLWIREPFLSHERDYGRLIVHGHTPLRTGLPDQRPNRLNIDTAAVYGGPLTAAVFTSEITEPIEFLQIE